MNKSVRIRLEPATFQRLKKLAAAKKCTLSEAALFCLAGSNTRPKGSNTSVEKPETQI